MRIVHAIGWYFPDSLGGSEVYVRSLCTALRSAGHEVFVTAPTLEQTVAYPHAGVPVFRYAISPPRSRDEAIGTIPVAGGERLSRWLADVHPDVLHVHSIVPGIGIAEIARAKA